MAKVRSGYSSDPRSRMKQAVDENIAAADEFANQDPDLYQKGDDLAFERLGPSAYQDLKYDGASDQYELDALAELSKRSKSGLTMRDKANLADIEDRTNASNRGRQEAIMSDFRARGAAGSGLEAVARMQASQDETNRAARESRETAARGEDARFQATQALGDAAASRGDRMYRRDSEKAAAADRINQYNTGLSNDAAEANWNRGNKVSDGNVGLKNDHRRAVYDVRRDASQTAYNSGADEFNYQQAEAAERQKRKAARGSAFGTILGAGVGAMAGPAGAGVGAGVGGAVGGLVSDENEKEDIRSESGKKIDALLNAMEPVSFKYKGDEKERHGIIAQDLEQSEIGDSIVADGPDGKSIDIGQAVGTLLAALAHLNRKVEAK